ncbi:MAG: LLM class flavin-dependent oxidoreductase [Candidatus Latescibacterota bacterium]|nr:MAG: LLM class flavin-dependent oxidoreductase [Candidatus Latescibacterota bacterium]
MQFDIFFSISQTPVAGVMPSELEMFSNFFQQVEAADALGFGTAWIAESHLSSEVQKQNREPVIPHWQGEVGLNVDFLQIAHQIFRRTRRIEAGSAVMNILCNGGPIAAAERVAAFCALHGIDPEETRRIHVGFAAGRFDFMNRASGIQARDEIEAAAWPVVKGKVFAEACEIFLRLLRGDTLASTEVSPRFLRREDFRDESQWAHVQSLAATAGPAPDSIPLAPRWRFEKLKIVPQEWRRELLRLVIGSHDPDLQEEVNRILPVQVFNLSITRAEVIEATHARMSRAYHPEGGSWQRADMPRTLMVFLNEQAHLGPEARRSAAREEARAALGAYWTALEGTLDPQKVERAADNAVVGNADDVSTQILERFHPEDRLMLWFDFFNHDSARVVANMEAFMDRVVPRLRAGGSA